MAFEYGSGTPIETEDEGNLPAVLPRRVPGHFTQNVTLGVDVPRHADALRIGLQFNIENLTNNIYKVSQESVFSPGRILPSQILLRIDEGELLKTCRII